VQPPPFRENKIQTYFLPTPTFCCCWVRLELKGSIYIKEEEEDKKMATFRDISAVTKNIC
jgi:hypothetical protein